MTRAGYFILLGAALHVAGNAAAGFAPGALALLLPVAIAVLLHAGLVRGLPLVAWIAFIMAIAATAVAVADLTASSSVPDWALWGVVVAMTGAVVLLFGVLWRGAGAQAGR